MRKLLSLVIWIYTIFVLGCASEKSDFAKAEKENIARQKNDLQSQQDSLNEFPASQYANVTEQRISESGQNEIDKTRANFGLPPSRFSLLYVDTTISLVLRKTLEVMINFPKPDECFFPENALILEPKTDDSVIYFVSLQTPGTGPIYRVDIAKGTCGEMKCFFLGRSQYEFIVSPDENMLLKLSCDEDEGGCENEEKIGCSPEAFSFCLLDLDKNEIRAIGKLPPGYSYATSVHGASNMSDELLPTGVYSWSRDDKLIHARVFSSRGSMQYGEPERKAVGEVKFGPNQVNVKL